MRRGLKSHNGGALDRQRYILITAVEGEEAFPHEKEHALRTSDAFDGVVLLWNWFWVRIFVHDDGVVSQGHFPACPRVTVVLAGMTRIVARFDNALGCLGRLGG